MPLWDLILSRHMHTTELFWYPIHPIQNGTLFSFTLSTQKWVVFISFHQNDHFRLLGTLLMTDKKILDKLSTSEVHHPVFQLYFIKIQFLRQK